VDSSSDSVFSDEHDDFLNSHLLVLNYVMDRTHPALSHQVDVVEGLAKYFSTVTVLTGSNSYSPNCRNIDVISSDWAQGKNLRNVLNFYYRFFLVIRRKRYASVFSHMTLVQSSLVAPILRILNIKHYVWYAHAKKTFFLSWTHFWANAIITSTRGSCPLQGEKVIYLGQSVDPVQFPQRTRLGFPLTKCVHVGRMDRSKNLGEIISSVEELRLKFPRLTLTLVGNPSSPDSIEYVTDLKHSWEKALASGWLTFEQAIPRAQVPEKLLENDIFVHAFSGSLDKSLVEATLTGMPVVTINQEYINEFGSWKNGDHSLNIELISLLEKSEGEVKREVYSRVLLGVNNHSFTTWILRLASILR
jgi:hypothetical protein